MRSIFARLFFGFLLTMLLGGLVSGVGVATFRHLFVDWQHGDMKRRMDDNLAHLIQVSGRAALDIFRCGGELRYLDFVDSLRRGVNLDIKVVVDDRVTVAGEELSPESVRLVLQARQARHPLPERHGDTLSSAGVIDGDDRAVVLGLQRLGPPPAMLPPGPEPGRPPGRPLLPPFFGPWEVVRMLVTLVVLAAVCFFLARSLAAPVKKLQQAARRLAGGDYSARVGSGIGLPGKELVELAREFDVMAERTENLISSQKRLLRDISHELRSPLARLTVALELAKKRFGGEHDPALGTIGREVARLDELIGDLLTLSRFESLAMEKAQFDLEPLLCDVAADADFEAAARGRGVRVVASEPAQVVGNRELLRRALENVIRNGATYTDPGTQVEIRMVVIAAQVEIRVEDCGPGVPEADIAHVFEPFYRVAEGRERSSGGAGIGLAIAWQAVKAHGGSLTVNNRVDRAGLSVVLTLPMRQST